MFVVMPDMLHTHFLSLLLTQRYILPVGVSAVVAACIRPTLALFLGLVFRPWQEKVFFVPANPALAKRGGFG